MQQKSRPLLITCIVNGRARSNNAAQMPGRLAHLFAEQGKEAKIVVPQKGEDISALARKAVSSGSNVVVAGGGDGTVSAVAAALVGTEAALGILPLGTLNHFAKDLGIPLDAEEALRTVFTGRPVQVDVCELNGQIFVNNSSIGIYPAIVQERSDQQGRGWNKWLAFARAVFTVLRRNPSIYASLHADGVFAAADRTPFVFVGNNPYETSGLHIGERSGLNSGRLWVCRAPDAHRFGLIRLAVRAALGRVTTGELETLEAEELWIRSKGRHLKVANDGELRKVTSPLQYRILPRALRVIVPEKNTRAEVA